MKHSKSSPPELRLIASNDFSTTQGKEQQVKFDDTAQSPLNGRPAMNKTIQPYVAPKLPERAPRFFYDKDLGELWYRESRRRWVFNTDIKRGKGKVERRWRTVERYQAEQMLSTMLGATVAAEYVWRLCLLGSSVGFKLPAAVIKLKRQQHPLTKKEKTKLEDKLWERQCPR